MRRSKLLVLLLTCLLAMGCFVTPVLAEEAENGTAKAPVLNWADYSYEELVVLREGLDTYIKELERQYAIENGNRIITLNEVAPTVYKGKTFNFEAEVTRVIEEAPENTEFTWTSSDETIATVSNKGIVTAVGYGDAVITCTAADDEYIFAEAMVHVVLPVEKLTIEESNKTLLLSEENPSSAAATLVYAVAPENAYVQDVTWSSSDEKIATVDEDGNVHAVAPGTVKITATSKEETNTPKSASCTVSVLQSVSAIELNAEEMTLNVRSGQNLIATILPENAGKKSVTWESSDPAIATVSASGRVTAVATGSATITCTATDGSGVTSVCEVTVIQMVNSLKIEAASNCITINKNESTDLSIIVSPEDATNKSVTWESSNPEIATVNSQGTVTAVGGGAATITCTAADGSGKSAKIDIYVPSIAMDELEYVVTSKNGKDISFKYYGKEENLTLSPASSTLFATEMEQDGENVTLTITPLKAGSGTITLSDKGDNRSKVKITIKIEHSACYDSVSYPVGNYTKIMRTPSEFDGEPMSVYGRVLQVSQGLFTTVLRVATQGRWDNVFYITCYGDVAESIIEGDYITIYGECEGTETYTTIMGGSVTIPAIEAEKIYLGRH